MIALLGATGYTGRLVAEELDRRGIDHRRGGRSADKLATLPSPASAAVETFVVDVSERSRLDVFLDGADAVINTVGPFAQLGVPVVQAAVDAGVTYVDSTGEFDYMTDVYLRFGSAASPVVPACGFDYIPGDLAAAIAAADLQAADPGDRIEDITIAYELSGMAPSRGTVRSAMGAAANTPFRPHARRARFSSGVRTAIEIPWGEQVTVPRHVRGADVATVVGLPGLAVMAPLLGVAARITKLALPLASPWVDRLPEGPSEAVRRRSKFCITANARTASGREAAVQCEGSDVYALTARFLVEAALRAAGSGAMAPGEALDPAPFLDAVSGTDPDFSWRRL